MTAGQPSGAGWAIVTGASRGLGAAVAVRLWSRGHSLVLVGRSRAALEALMTTLDRRPGQQAHAVAVDLAEPSAPMDIVTPLRTDGERISVLVNNAAIQGPIGPAWDNPHNAWQQALRVNLLAPVELCQLCVPLMTPGGGAIVNISGGGATAPRPNFSAYATGKAALVRFSETLAAETMSRGISVNCVAPGAMPSAMTDAILHAGEAASGAGEFAAAQRVAQQGDAVVARAADLCVYLTSEAGRAITGRLISAVWDPWESLADRADEVKNTDVYTLRRIVPSDRGMTWGDR